MIKFCLFSHLGTFIHLLANQETEAESASTFNTSGWEILHSGASNAKHHGVGFVVYPSLRPHVTNFLAHSPRICEITLHTNPHPVTFPSTLLAGLAQLRVPVKIRHRKHFWSQLHAIVSEQGRELLSLNPPQRLRTLQGDQLPSTHPQLVEPARQNYTVLRTVYHVVLGKVPSHVGIRGNELADALVLRSLSNGRAPGPDSTPADMLKHLCAFLNDFFWITLATAFPPLACLTPGHSLK